MFHGGTSFGLTSGANDKGTYAPIITSYDYDAPLDEAGHPTAKYWAFRDVIARYAPVPADRPAAADARPGVRGPGHAGGALVDASCRSWAPGTRATSPSAPTSSARSRGSRCTRPR